LGNDLFYRDIGINASNGERIWEVFVGRESYGAAVSYTGAYYVVCEAKVIYVYDYRTGEKISYWETPAQSWSMPALYDNMLYVGFHDFAVRCFGEAQGATYLYPSLGISLDKTQITIGASVTVTGRISPTLIGIPVKVHFVKPNNEVVDIQVLTDANGTYHTSYKPDVTGEWKVVAYYPGSPECNVAEALSSTLTVQVAESPPPPPPPPEQPEVGLPMDIVYALIVVVAIVVIAAAVYVLKKKRK
jgi:hypothetical protein